ncbi:hypothetical protein SpAn4DRAFT_0974 [Sporomusa ovata]|uniref:Uncharacterized protein n=1 Tax=Sporomusa ovata TaxID=2378 RepID=A0A0U1L481_9FIRM|nr:hypothetical protein SpAn4DRAFT_0974 [Sporomusa ovata]
MLSPFFSNKKMQPLYFLRDAFFLLSSHRQPPCIKSIIYVIAELKKERVNIDPRQRRKVLKERKEKMA